MDMGPREAVVTEPRRGEEVQMSLQRDDLAARFAVALVARDYPSADTARFAMNMADALLARLAQDRPAAPSRPEWVPSVGDVVKHVNE